MSKHVVTRYYLEKDDIVNKKYYLVCAACSEKTQLLSFCFPERRSKKAAWKDLDAARKSIRSACKALGLQIIVEKIKHEDKA